MKTVFSSPDAPPALGPYSQAIGAGPFVFCSGQVPILAATGELISQDLAEQTKQALLNLGAVLQSAGLSYANIVKTTVFLTDLSRFADMNAVYAKFFQDDPPARSTFEVSGLPRGAKVEIEAIAVKPS
ncbi:MAG TPA: RidA family protein [Chthoniobacterales bacterium]|nr:RidA family protein [Chthoniobacterales bacterium]